MTKKKSELEKIQTKLKKCKDPEEKLRLSVEYENAGGHTGVPHPEFGRK